MTKLITNEIDVKLRDNHNAILNGADACLLQPVVKFFTPDAAATWIIVSGESVGDDMHLWGWCDLGVGFPEYGTVSLNELQTLRGHYGMPVERDLYFNIDQSIEEYVNKKSVV